MNIILLGSPGAGKGTLASFLSKKFNYSHFSTGDILREEIKSKTTIGKKITNILNKGELVKDDLMIKIIKSKTKKATQGTILDGFPRTYNQILALEKIIKIDLVIYLYVSKTVAFKRVFGRLKCKKCTSIFNIYYKPHQKKGVCDDCGGTTFEKRSDDNKEIFDNRIAIFEKTINDLIFFYDQKNVLVKLNGEEKMEIIQKKVFEKITAK